jgi:hypothetical protein
MFQLSGDLVPKLKAEVHRQNKSGLVPAFILSGWAMTEACMINASVN